jgi:DNA-binding transcriptional MocR family regulator
MSAAATTVRTLAGWREIDEPGLQERLAAAIERALLDGRIALEARVPSERDLATELGVSRATVAGAYASLRAGGWIVTRRGSGSVARIPARLRHGLAPSDVAAAGGAIDLRKAAPAAPIDAYRAAVGRALETITPQLTTSTAPEDLHELRALIAERHARRGVPTRPEQILLTCGAVPGLWLVLAALFPRVPSVLVETPTYPQALAALRQRRAQVFGWPMLDGWDVAEFEALARQHRASAAYLVPDFHNPTGQLMPAELRPGLAAAAARADVLLIADETMVDLDQRAGAPGPGPALAGANVVALGSLSKTVWDGLRVGWIRAEERLIAKLAAHPLAAQVAAAPFEQAVAAAILPGLDEVTEARRHALRARRDHLLGRVRELPGIAVERPPAGGLSAWCTLERASSARLSVAAAERGVLVDPGGRFAAAGGLDGYLRIPYSLPEEQLDVALERLAPLLAA